MKRWRAAIVPAVLGALGDLLLVVLLILTAWGVLSRANAAPATAPVAAWCLDVEWRAGLEMHWRNGVFGAPCRFKRHEADV